MSIRLGRIGFEQQMLYERNTRYVKSIVLRYILANLPPLDEENNELFVRDHMGLE